MWRPFAAHVWVILGTAIQFLLEPDDPAILDSLDMLGRFFS